MELIKNLAVPPFQRVIWANQKARQVWEPQIRRISERVQELEILSVAHDQRPCAWQTFQVRNFPAMTKKIIDLGLSIYPIQLCGSWGQGFIHYTPALRDDDPNPQASCIVTKSPDLANEFWKAYNRGDHITQGKLLGFPECCTKFFNEQWARGYFDPIWQMVEPIADTPTEMTFWNERPDDRWHSLLFSNPILRYIGIRVGFHIPCRFDCSETQEIARKRIELLSEGDQIVLISLLRMPMTWSVYRGIAIVKTPIFTLLTQSVPSLNAHTITIRGDFYPVETQPGSCFPYILPEAK